MTSALGPNPKLVLLHRATARLTLVSAGDMTIDMAFDGLVPAFQEIMTSQGHQPRCTCELKFERELVARWERADPRDSWRHILRGARAA